MYICIGNLSNKVTESDIQRQFEAFGKVISVSIIKDNINGQSKGFGFVDMLKLTDGHIAITKLNRKRIKGRAVTVSGATLEGGGWE